MSMVQRFRDVTRRYTLTYGAVRGMKMLALRTVGREHHGVVKLRDLGFEHPIWIRSGTSDELVVVQVFGKLDYEIDYLVEPTTIVDAGANIGLVSVYLARKFPDARIVAIEPGAESFELLEKNTAPYPNITALCAAVWSHTGSVQLIDPGIGEWGLQTKASADTIDPSQAAVRSGEVPAMTIQDAMDLLDPDHLGLLKIDVEGAESEVFATSEPWIGKVDSIMAELHERFSPGCSTIFDDATAEFAHRSKLGENFYLCRDAAATPAAT